MHMLHTKTSEVLHSSMEQLSLQSKLLQRHDLKCQDQKRYVQENRQLAKAHLSAISWLSPRYFPTNMNEQKEKYIYLILNYFIWGPSNLVEKWEWTNWCFFVSWQQRECWSKQWFREGSWFIANQKWHGWSWLHVTKWLHWISNWFWNWFVFICTRMCLTSVTKQTPTKNIVINELTRKFIYWWRWN